MRINISVNEFKEALNKVLSVVDKKNTRQILNFIQIEASGNSLEITATDLEVSAKIKLNCHVDNPGTICVNAKNIFDIISRIQLYNRLISRQTQRLKP